MKSWLCPIAAVALLAGCHEGVDDSSENPPPAAPAATEADPLPPLPSAQIVPQTQLAVARTLTFVREDDGVSLGFDLDGRISDRSDRESCGQPDYTSPDGEEGIDNALALVVPLIERVGGAALEGLVQAAINEGDLLVMIELDGVDSLEADDDVTLTMMRGVGQPFIGTDERIEQWQTFDADLLAPWSRAPATIRDGVLEAGPVEIQLPIYVFDFEFLVTVTDARVRMVLGEDGPQWGMVGGVVLMQNLLDIANNIEGGQNIPGTLDTVGRTFADMLRQEDGTCAGLSTVIEMDLANAWFYADAERPDR